MSHPGRGGIIRPSHPFGQDPTTMPPTRILYVITELDPGGAEKALHSLVARLDRERFAPEVACLSGDGEVGRWIEAEGVAVHRLHLRAWNAPLAAVRLWRLMRRGQFDLVHTFLFHANVLGRLATRLAAIPAVVSSVRVEEPRRWHQLLNRLTWRLADRIVCVSKSTAEFFCRACGAASGRVIAIPNGVDTERYRPTDRPPAPIQDPVRIVSVGRLDPQKGYDVLIEAARICTERDMVFETTIAGDGPERAALQQQIDAAGLADTVRLVGRSDDVPVLLASSDLFVSSSRWEGMPNAVLEAMATGLPVVATSVGGTPEVVAHGRTGLLVPPEDPAALAAAMADLVLDATRRRELGCAGRARVEAEFTWETNADAHMALYEGLLPIVGGRP